MGRAYTDALRPCVLSRKMVKHPELKLLELAIFAVWRLLGTRMKGGEVEVKIEKNQCSCGKTEERKRIAASRMTRRVLNYLGWEGIWGRKERFVDV